MLGILKCSWDARYLLSTIGDAPYLVSQISPAQGLKSVQMNHLRQHAPCTHAQTPPTDGLQGQATSQSKVGDT